MGSTQKILCKNSAKNGEQPPKRRIVEMITAKKGGGEGTLEFDLKNNETMKLQVYTRSELGGQFSIYKCSGPSKTKNKTPVAENIRVARTNGSDGPTPFSVNLDDLEGAGEYV